MWSSRRTTWSHQNRLWFPGPNSTVESFNSTVRDKSDNDYGNKSASRRPKRHEYQGGLAVGFESIVKLRKEEFMSTDLVTADLTGDPNTRGVQYGKFRAEAIQSCISAWIDSLGAVGILYPHRYIEEMSHRTGFVSAINEHCPDLFEEVRGIAAGAGLPLELVYGAQLMDEEWAYRARMSGNPAQLEKCSSAAVRAADGAVIIGQNMDLGGYTNGHQILLRLAPHGSCPGALIFSVSSMIALLGVNARRIGVCVNAIPQLSARDSGLPVAFVIRKLLQARTLAEAVNMIRTLPHATSQHYLIADPSSIRSFEASPERVVEYESPHLTGVLHTNHPLAPPFVVAPEGGINSVARLSALWHYLGRGNPDLAAMKAALSSRDDPEHPVSRTLAGGQVSQSAGMISFTTGSMISELRSSSEAIDTWVSAGPPSIHGYSPVSLTCEL